MTEDNVMEFCQWLVSEKGIEAGNLSDYINNNEEEVLKLAEEFKKPKFKVGGKVEAAAEMFKCGGKAKKVNKDQKGGLATNHTIYDLKTGKVTKKSDGIGRKETYVNGPSSMTLGVIDGDTTILTKNPNWPESRVRSFEEIDTGRRQRNIGFGTELRSFEGMRELFKKRYPNVKTMQGGGEANNDGIKRLKINFGPEVSTFEDNTGEYKRVVFKNPADTLWSYKGLGTNRFVGTDQNGYVGMLEDIYGNNRFLTTEEANVLKNSVESRIKNIPYKKHLLEKYGDEMLLPENKAKIIKKP